MWNERYISPTSKKKEVNHASYIYYSHTTWDWHFNPQCWTMQNKKNCALLPGIKFNEKEMKSILLIGILYHMLNPSLLSNKLVVLNLRTGEISVQPAVYNGQIFQRPFGFFSNVLHVFLDDVLCWAELSLMAHVEVGHHFQALLCRELGGRWGDEAVPQVGLVGKPELHQLNYVQNGNRIMLVQFRQIKI